jgi:two-component system, NtrC family, sensor kinase
MNVLHRPLRRKLRYVILTTCAVSLLVACAVVFAVQFYFFRTDYERDLKSVAEMIANSSIPATDVGFAARERAAEVLGGLAAKPHVIGAQLHKHSVDESGELATYRSVPFDFGKMPPPAGPRTWREGGLVVYAQPISYRNERLGTLYVVSDYGSLASRLINLYVSVLFAVLAASVLVGLLVSTKLAHYITGPIENLAATVRRIAGSNDYTVRAEKTADDEVGAFTDSFNEMIERIQSRDAALQHEIAERKRAEREVEVMHGQLLDASRQAGMAEVATGVLHNVGNVLNSVNVSATLVAEKLNMNRLNNLQRTAEMLRTKNGDLAGFLGSDPKGKLIPSYLKDLSEHLLAEHREALHELDLLAKNIEHIKEIVSMQQNYARVAGFVENLPPESLAEDALRMTTGSLQRHHIEIIRDFSPCRPVTAERHKVLQILVNIIRNAKHALDEASPPVKILTLSVRPAGDSVAISVTDNGTGITEENLTRIFAHGFTTRKDGHGFGLHSAALAAQQMKGRLTARSPGHGRGATFILELPCAKVEAAK